MHVYTLVWLKSDRVGFLIVGLKHQDYSIDSRITPACIRSIRLDWILDLMLCCLGGGGELAAVRVGGGVEWLSLLKKLFALSTPSPPPSSSASAPLSPCRSVFPPSGSASPPALLLSSPL